MQNRNCKKCGKVFRYVTGYPLCDECKLLDEDEFLKVKEYIRLNPGVKIDDVAEALELNPRQILRYLQEERLEIPDTADKFISCEVCGRIIRTGRFCDNCKAEINHELGRDSSNSLGDTYYFSEDEEKKISKLRYKKIDK